jgi:4-diphosphocytidyl-2-C-methyl-D-erythritol kinase
VTSLRLAAPAKVNLGLRVRGRRRDGYHRLESLFLPLDFGDEVVLERVAGGLALALEGDAEGVPAGEANLACRAARAFLEAAGLPVGGLRVRLRKRVPAAAGLGGGSSDAGAVLRGLRSLHPDALDPAALDLLALALGADVPFFLDPRPAWVTGIGEEREAVAGVPALPLLLANPGRPLSTAAVFEAFDALRAAPGPGAASLTPAGADPTVSASEPYSRAAAPGRARTVALLQALRTGGTGAGSAGALAEALANDLEAAAVRLCPAVAALRRSIEEVGAVAVGLSGSGPTVYGIFAVEEEARAARARLALAPPARSWVVTTVASEPPG